VIDRAVPHNYHFRLYTSLSTVTYPTTPTSDMDTYQEPPKTPPRSVYPLTPSASGQSVKRVRFADPGAINSSSKRLKQQAEDDAVPELLSQIHEGTSGGTYRIYTGASLYTEGKSVVQVADPSAASVRSRKTILGGNDSFASLAIAIDAPIPAETFPLMELTLAIRTRIYEYLLVVPAIICVRQNHTTFRREKQAFLYAESRELRPGIAFALTQLVVGGHKSRFSQLAAANVNILRVSKQVYAEAKPVMYSNNNFEITKPTHEVAPPVDFSVCLFPPGYQHLVTKLNIRIRSFYDLSWLLGGGYNAIKNYYRGLIKLTLILEMESSSKSYGKKWSRTCGEEWTDYIQRLQGQIVKDLFAHSNSEKTNRIPAWIHLRILFSGEAYDEHLIISGDGTHALQDGLEGQVKRSELKRAKYGHYSRKAVRLQMQLSSDSDHLEAS
jgi:hypothetical protein